MYQDRNQLDAKIAAAKKWWRLSRGLAGLAAGSAAACLLILICFRADLKFVLSPSARVTWKYIIVFTALGTAAAGAAFAALKRLSDRAIAAEVERCYPSLKERLLSTIELIPTLAAGGESAGFSRSMTLSLADETSRAAAEMDFKRAIDTRVLRRSSVTAACCFGLLLLQRFAAPDAFDNWLRRMNSPHSDIPVWANTRVWITPEKELLPVGENAGVTVTTRGVHSATCTLFYRQAGDNSHAWKSLGTGESNPVSATSNAPAGDAQEFKFKLNSLPASVEIYARANDGRSNDKTIVVEPRPTLINVKMTMHFPAYMHREPQTIPSSTGNIAAPYGTVVDITGEANKPLKSALFNRNGTPVGPWPIDQDKASGKIDVRKDGTYQFSLTDTHGFANAMPPVRYDIHSIPDLAPTVLVSKPSADIDLVPDGSIPLVAHATDDYGVASMRLAYARQQADAMSRTGAASMKTIAAGTLPLPIPAAGPQVQLAQRWHIGSLHGKPGDVIRFEVDAIDNDTLDGPHIGRSGSLNIHIVSLVEMQRKLKDSLDEESRALEQLRNTQMDAQKQLQQARAKHDPAALAKAQEAQRAVADEARAITQRVGDVSAQLENNNLATKSEIQRRADAQQTLQDIAQQKAPAAADAVQHAQAPKTAQAEQSQQLTKAAREQAEIRKDIDHAQDLLTRTPPADQLAAEAKRLAAEQARLADTARSISEGIKEQRQQTGKNELSPELKIGLETERQQQQQASAETRRLEKQLNAAATAAEERGQTKQAEALRTAANALKQAGVQAQQAQAEQNLAGGKPEKAAPQQDRAAAGLEKAAQQAQQAAAPEQNAANTAEQLEKAAAQLRDLARQQQEAAQKAAQNPSAAQAQALADQERSIQQQAQQQQQNLNGSQQAQQSLQQAQQNLNQAGKQLSQNQAQQAQAPAKQAAQNLQQAAQQAENAAQQIRQTQAANELADRVERLAQVQSALKNQTERLQNTRQQRPLTPNERGELGQVAARQQNLEEEAKAIAERFPSPSFQNALRNAAKQAHPATKNLNPEAGNQPDTGKETQAAQARAAGTLGAVAQALKTQAQASKDQQQNQQQQDAQQQQSSAQQAQEAAALGELALAQGLQQQVRQGTNQLEQDRKGQPLSQQQQQQARQLAQDQQETQNITQRAQEALSNLPGVPESLNTARQNMDRSQQNLKQQQTGAPTQGHQENALQNLAQAQQRAQQAMQQQQQQQQAQQQAKQGAPQPTRKPGQQPDKNAFTRLEGPGGDGARSAPERSNGKFGALSQRAQRTMREGQQERVPAEFQDLVNRYYKSLAEKKR